MMNRRNKGKGKEVDFNDLTIEGMKLLVPEMAASPLVNSIVDTSNPGIRLISNDGDLLEMLKIVYIEDMEAARNIAEALAECSEFLLDENDEPDPEVLLRVEWIKYILALSCSVKGRFADAYKQASTGVLTNAMGERGWQLLGFPVGGTKQNKENHNKKRF